MFQHFGRLLLELLKYASIPGPEKLALVEWEGEERVGWHTRTVKASFSVRAISVLGATGACACAEVPADGGDGAPARQSALARAARANPDVEGNPVLYRRGAVRKALRLLAEGKGVGILIDQHMTSPDAIYVDFFGRPAATTSTLAALAMRTGAPVVPLFALPLPNGRYKMIYEHPVQPRLKRRLRRCGFHAAMHGCVDARAQAAELWLWMHRRWRDTPSAALDRARMFPAAAADESNVD